MKNVLFVSGIGGDTRRYRCLHHQEQLALHGITSTLCTADDLAVYRAITTHDLLILHRTPYSALIADLIELAHLQGAPVIFETDDLIFEPELYGSIDLLNTLPPEAANQFRQDLYGQAKTFAFSDVILTTTGYLAQAAARHGKPVFVQRNACSAEMLRNAETAYAQRSALQPADPGAQTRPVVIGYFSGTGSHNRDFATITPALLAILERYPEVWLHVSGQLDLDGRFLAYRDRIRRAPFVAWQELPNLVAGVDINLAPLELENPFCQAKSEIKYTEAALVGVPTIASPTDAFVYAIQPNQTGLLATTVDEWEAALVHLIEQPDERKRLGEAARRQVYAAYAPEPRSQELVATLAQIKTTITPAADPARVPTLVADALLRQIDRLVAEGRQQARQLDQLRQTLAAWEAKADDRQREFWRRNYEQAASQHTEALRTILARLQQGQPGIK